MKCTICKHGNTKEGFSTITLERNETTVVFKNVPSLVCDNCGEKYIEQDITSKILLKANEIAKSGVEVDIRKFQIAA